MIPDRSDTRRTTAAPSENRARKSPSPARKCMASTNNANPNRAENLSSTHHRIPRARLEVRRARACAKLKLPTPASDDKDRAAPSARTRRRVFHGVGEEIEDRSE